MPSLLCQKEFTKTKTYFLRKREILESIWNFIIFQHIVCGIYKSFAIENPSSPLYLSLVGRLILTESAKGELKHLSFFSLGMNVLMYFE